MGYTAHHAIVVTDSGYESEIEAIRAKAIEIGLDVSDIVGPRENGYRSFLIAPDGAKEGSPGSDDGGRQRQAFLDYLRAEHHEAATSRATATTELTGHSFRTPTRTTTTFCSSVRSSSTSTTRRPADEARIEVGPPRSNASCLGRDLSLLA